MIFRLSPVRDTPIGCLTRWISPSGRLSLNALTRPVDPHRDYSLYFLATWNQNPPVLRHEGGSDDCLGKFIGPQVLNRIASGSDANLDLERLILEHAYLSDPPGLVLCRNGASARVLEGFIFRYLRDHNPGWKAMVQQTLQGWIDNADRPPGTNYGYWRNEGTPFTAELGARIRGRTRSCCWPRDSSSGPKPWRRLADTSIMWRTIAVASTGAAGGFWVITTNPLTRASISTSTAFTSRFSSNAAC